MKPAIGTLKGFMACAVLVPFAGVDAARADCPPTAPVTRIMAVARANTKVIPRFDSVNPAVITRELQAMGFAVAKLAEESSAPRGQFLRSVPAACQSARVDSTVTLYISNGPAPQPVQAGVPQPTATTETVPREALPSPWSKPRPTPTGSQPTVATETQTPGVPPSSRPTSKPTSVVTQTEVESQPDLVEIPRYKPAPDAGIIENLHSRRFNVSAARGEESNLPEGYFIRTMPAGGTRVPVGTQVEVFFSNHQKLPVRVRIPEFGEVQIKLASQKLAAIGLRMRLDDESSVKPRGIVIRTSPPEGSLVDLNSTVTVFYSEGPSHSLTWFGAIASLAVLAVGGVLFAIRPHPKLPLPLTVRGRLERGIPRITVSHASPPRVTLICVLGPADGPQLKPVGNWSKQ